MTSLDHLLTPGRPLTSWCELPQVARLERYRELGGLEGLRRASAMARADRLTELRDSGLRAAGPTSVPLFASWDRATEHQPLAVDASSLDPRSRSTSTLLTENPFGLLEGLLIAARALEADRAVLRLPAALARLEGGLLAAWSDLHRSGLCDGLELTVDRGHRLPGSIHADGRDPRGDPALVHSLETWYQLVLVFALGATTFRRLNGGPEPTRLVTLGGEVRQPGLLEVPSGASVRQILEEHGGGPGEGAPPLAVALDGGLGGLLPSDSPLGFDCEEPEVCSHPATLWVVGRQSCPVALTRDALYHHWKLAEGHADRAFIARAARLVTQIGTSPAARVRLADLERAHRALRDRGLAAACPLGSALAYFRPAWEAHLDGRGCAAGVCFERPPPPCQAACPSNLDIPSFLAHIGHHHYDDAVRVIAMDNPLPMTCGLVCPAPCESACVRGSTSGGPVFIRPMKAVAARHSLEHSRRYELPTPLPGSHRRVAVVGSGPAGLAASYFLTLRGHRVAVFEAEEKAGGMLRYGIPAHRLPPALLDLELAEIERLGVTLHTGQRIERLSALRERGFDAVLVAPGFQRSRTVPFEGADLPLVRGGLDFLRGVRAGRDPRLGNRVVVIGGGNVAVDVALTAGRQGAREVTMVCLEKRHEMPASPEEIKTALAEDISIQNGWGPLAVNRQGTIVFQRCSKVFDEQRRFAPRFDRSRTLALDADQVLLAVGQTLDDGFLDDGQVEVQRGHLRADLLTLETGSPGVFAGGDAVHGAQTVVAAVRAGKQAAASIDAWLRGVPLDPRWGRPERRDRVEPLRTEPPARGHLGRSTMPEREVGERRTSHQQIELGLTDAMADQEASRCLRCDLCIGCGLCELVCSEAGPEALRLEQTPSGRLAFQDFERPKSLCVGCGACAEVCPTGAIQIEDAGGLRQTVVTGTVVKAQPLLMCGGCGRPLQPEAQRSQLGSRLGPQAQPHLARRLCPACARQEAAKGAATAQVDRPRIG